MIAFAFDWYRGTIGVAYCNSIAMLVFGKSVGERSGVGVTA